LHKCVFAKSTFLIQAVLFFSSPPQKYKVWLHCGQSCSLEQFYIALTASTNASYFSTVNDLLGSLLIQQIVTLGPYAVLSLEAVHIVAWYCGSGGIEASLCA